MDLSVQEGTESEIVQDQHLTSSTHVQVLSTWSVGDVWLRVDFETLDLVSAIVGSSTWQGESVPQTLVLQTQYRSH